MGYRPPVALCISPKHAEFAEAGIATATNERFASIFGSGETEFFVTMRITGAQA